MKETLNRIAFLACADLSTAEVALRRIPNDDPNGCFVPDVMRLIQEGKAKLCEIHLDGQLVGHTVYQIEDFSGHREFVSVATTTRTKSPLRFDLEKLLLTLAAREECKSIRMHTCRAGLVRDALNTGWHTAEIVIRKHL
jgi:hypothetical protein